MQALAHRLEQVATLRTILTRNKDNLIQAALQDCAFNYRESALEVEADCMEDFP